MFILISASASWSPLTNTEVGFPIILYPNHLDGSRFILLN